METGIDYVGVSTAFFCHDGKGNLLLHKRSNKCRDEHGRWDSGSGKLEIKLSFEDNVLKEISEEYGCGGLIQEKLAAKDLFREHEGKKTHWVIVPFFVLVNPAEVKNNEPEKIDEVGWFTLDTLPSPLHSGFAKDLENYKEKFDEYLRK